MDLNAVHANVHKRTLKKRVGRGIGSGHGKTATRGQKGQYASAGAEMFGAWYEGGQMPIVRRSPKRGFSNASWAIKYQVVNVGDLDGKFDAGSKIDLDALKAKRVLTGKEEHFRVLGTGEIKTKLDVHAHGFSASAKAKIEAAGGTATVIPGPKKPVRNKMGSKLKAAAVVGEARKARAAERAQKAIDSVAQSQAANAKAKADAKKNKNKDKKK